MRNTAGRTGRSDLKKTKLTPEALAELEAEMKALSTIRIVSAEYLEGHRLRVTFTDGVTGIADFAGDVTDFLELLADPAIFASVEVERGSLAWPGLDIHLDTTHTYMLVTGKGLRR